MPDVGLAMGTGGGTPAGCSGCPDRQVDNDEGSRQATIHCADGRGRSAGQRAAPPRVHAESPATNPAWSSNPENEKERKTRQETVRRPLARPPEEARRWSDSDRSAKTPETARSRA